MILLVAALGLAQSSQTALRGSGPWRVDQSDSLCSVAQEFRSTNNKVELGFRLIPVLQSYSAVFIGTALGTWRRGNVRLTLTSAHKQLEETATLSALPDGRPVLTINFSKDDIDNIARQSELAIDLPDGTKLSAKAVDKVFAAAATCQTELVRSWGIDPNDSNLKPTPIYPRSWVSNDDYPPSALAAGIEGVVSFRLTVGADGKVAGCGVLKSSGYKVLDDAVCPAMQGRGRFIPAKRPDGTPVPSLFVSRYTWTLGG